MLKLIIALKKEIGKLTPKLRKQIMNKLHALELNPRPRDAVKLTNSNELFRIRHRDYRVIYQIQDHKLLVLVVKVGHRREIYRKLN